MLQMFKRTNRIIIFLALAAVPFARTIFTLVRLFSGIYNDHDAAHYSATPPLLSTKGLRSSLVLEEDSALGATGSVFTGEKMRQYRGRVQLVSQSTSSVLKKSTALFPLLDVDRCQQWAVVTTIFKPQLAFQKILDLSSKWCLVIVGDEITPDDEYEKFSQEHEIIYYLSATYQKKYLESNKFMSMMPYKSFARKNVGYLFAVHHGAKVVFDFDDDNILSPMLQNTSLAPPFFWMNQINDKDEWQEASMLLRFFDKHDTEQDPRLSFNPFKYFNPSITNSWPRGFPLDDLQEDFETEAKKVLVGDIAYKAIGVIQSLCDGNPDTDAIFRLTRANATEFTFSRSTKSLPLLVPFSHYTPYNAQATTHLYGAFWGLYLPISVPGRVTDIWRSYIVQRLMKDVGLYLVYSQPIVQHKRSPHEYLADFTAEADLYHKTAKLINHIDRWSSSKESFPERIMDLWIELFEHNYLGLEDVEAIRQWLNTLISIGYEFPSLVEDDDVQLPRIQPTLEGQPYRAYPGYPQIGRSFDTQLSKDRLRQDRPKHAIVKIIMMTMDEWPLLESWVSYHGNIYGFQNLYVIDSSTNPHCKSFLLYARDILGVNVLFSRANLNQLEKLMTRIGFDLSGSSDYIIKMDTDEYLAVYDEDTSTLKPSLANQYLSQLMKNVSKPEDQRACIRFVQNSVPTKDLCNKDINTAPHLFPFQSAYSLPFYKAIYDSRYIHKYGINLGGHSHRFGDDCVNKGNFGIIHAHWRCFEVEMENNRRVLLRHKYFNEADGKDIILEKLGKVMSKVIHKADECTYVRDGCGIGSCHKAEPYMNFLLCPDKARDTFYTSGGDNYYTIGLNLTKNQSHNSDFENTMQSSLTKFGL